MCGKIRIYLQRLYFKTDQQRTYLPMFMRFSDFLNKSMACNLKTMNLLDCAQRGMCSNWIEYGILKRHQLFIKFSRFQKVNPVLSSEQTVAILTDQIVMGCNLCHSFG